jgi:hypothetical protein
MPYAVAYKCDHLRCKDGCNNCGFTTDIEHAVNFKYLGAGKFIEEEPKYSFTFKANGVERTYAFNGDLISTHQPEDNDDWDNR